MKLIGITGGIASGKTLVTNKIRENNYTVIDADEISRELLEEPKIIDKLKTIFGDKIIENEKINRKSLGEIVFEDEELRIKLESIIHPKVKKIIKKELKKYKNEKIVFVDVPLLYEANMEGMMDKVVVVYVDEQTQRARLMKRDKIDFGFALQKINSQIPLSEKFQVADYIINNDGEIHGTEEQVLSFLKELENEI